MLELITLIVRAVQFIFALIVVGLAGHVSSDSGDLTPSRISFMIFTAVWTMLVLVYLALAPRFMAKFAHPFAILAVDAVTMVFWFAAFVALAVWYDNFSYYLDYGYGECTFCSIIKAAIAFGALSWVLFIYTTVMAALGAFRNRGNTKITPTTGPIVTADA